MTSTQTTTRNPTEKQVAFLRTLLAERAGNVAAEAVRDQLNAHRDNRTLTSKVMSDAITALLDLPRTDTPSPAPAAVQVADGSYALVTGEQDHPIRFFEVRTGTGRWTGRTFLDEYASDNRYPVRDVARRNDILTAIAANPDEAGKRWSDEFGTCARCHRGLTDDTSRERGYGPDCWAKIH